MTPIFAKAIDTVFLMVLGLLDRIGQGESLDPKVVRNRIKGWLNDAENELSRKKEWQLAKYAIISWIDEVMIDAPWKHSRWWNENKLETELLGTNDREWNFYVQANEATKLPDRDALQVYYIAVVLGFRGIYRDPAQAPFNAHALNEQHAVAGLDLPDQVERWVEQIGGLIPRGKWPRIPPDKTPLPGAEPLEGFMLLIWAVCLGGVLTVLIVLFCALFLIQ